MSFLNKRVYSKSEFETQYKQLKSENEDLNAKLKVSERIRKQQKNSIKDLQSQINRLRNPKLSQPKSNVYRPTMQSKANTKAK